MMKRLFAPSRKLSVICSLFLFLDAPRLLIGSHLDTVFNAGAYDGILGVVLGIALLSALNGRKFPFAIEVIGFSEEEGVRFSTPFIGSRALIATGSPLTTVHTPSPSSTNRNADCVCRCSGALSRGARYWMAAHRVGVA